MSMTDAEYRKAKTRREYTLYLLHEAQANLTDLEVDRNRLEQQQKFAELMEMTGIAHMQNPCHQLHTVIQLEQNIVDRLEEALEAQDKSLLRERAFRHEN